MMKREVPICKSRGLPFVLVGTFLGVLLTVSWVLTPGVARAAEKRQQKEPVPCKVELILTKIEVVRDTDRHALDKWKFTIEATKRDATGSYSDQFARDRGDEGYDVDVIPFMESGANKGEDIILTMTVTVKELDRADRERGRNGSDLGTITIDPKTIRCPRAGATRVVNFNVTVPVARVPAAPPVPNVERNGSLKFFFVCVLND
ncbi:MAG: hypothetical protein RX318_09925 [bacterium]|nr:hypothetical protein [bacterium]